MVQWMPMITMSLQKSDHLAQNHTVPVHWPQLDGLRAMAVLMVLWSHWAPKPYRSVAGTDLGYLGVQLFFVLSGFLITGILMDVFNKVDKQEDRWLALRRFYTRRALRIFPLYYVIVALVVLFGVGPFRETWPWHVAYLSNFNFFLTGSHIGTYGGHLWSLSVEEQFYLFWPFILFVPRKLHVVLILCLISAAPVFRAGMWYLNWGKYPEAAMWLTPAVLDSLGAGGLLACLERRNTEIVTRIALLMFLLSAVGLIAVHFFPFLGFLKQSFLAAAFACVIWRSSRGIPGAFGKFLECKPMMYIGSISYGIYLIHGFASPFWQWLCYSSPIPLYRIFKRLHLHPDVWQEWWFAMCGMAVLTLATAGLSYRFFEKPILSLKSRLPYRRNVV
jgi:peptidoglycan/LPS O-acetylase OafA/YrhL